MKSLLKIYLTTKKARIFTAFVLTGILSFTSGLTLLKSVTAAPLNLLPEKVSQVIKDNTENNDLPESVSQAVIQDLSRRTNINPRKLKIISYSQKTWNNGCLGIPNPGEFCTQALVEGWQVIVSDGSKKWIYRTNINGRSVRLENTKIGQNQPTAYYPQSMQQAVLKAASQRLNVPVSQLIIMQSKRQMWKNDCLELADADEVCKQVLVLGWRVIVGAPEQSLVYHSNYTGSVVRLNEKASEISKNSKTKLPQNIAEQVLSRTSQQSKLPVNKLQIVEAKKQQWSDTCLGINESETACATMIVPGWKVTVSDGQQRWVYRVGEILSIKYDQDSSKISDRNTIPPVTIPNNELPSPLNKDVIFRQISSGGFAGLTYQSILLNDGRLIRTRVGDSNDSVRSVHRISPIQLQRFQQLLKQQENEFDNLSYPPSANAADYITYTLTSSKGSVQYNDISQNTLPQNLRTVIQFWNDMGKN
ncbi:MAG: hypothetical protein QNJ47_06235 [Nostocaceae cyanobacterium]|nr:hypothetical protein [Nostocaceae cyanobacterium]